MVIYGYLWLFMVIYGYLWLFMVICGYLWLFMVIYGYLWLFTINSAALHFVVVPSINDDNVKLEGKIEPGYCLYFDDSPCTKHGHQINLTKLPLADIRNSHQFTVLWKRL